MIYLLYKCTKVIMQGKLIAVAVYAAYILKPVETL